jgi:hypothetical protein
MTFDEPAPTVCTRGVVNTDLVPYDTDVDLSDVPVTADDAMVPLVKIDAVDIALSTMRNELAARYDAQARPDIHTILTLGTILLRNISAERIPHSLMFGTDRAGNSAIGNMYHERDIARAHRLDPADVTYLSVRQHGWQFGESENITARRSGGFLIYDPRYVVKLGRNTNGFSTFTRTPRLALLGVIQSTHPEAAHLVA